MKLKFILLLLCLFTQSSARLLYEDDNNRLYTSTQYPPPSSFDGLAGTRDTASALHASSIGHKDYDVRPKAGDRIVHDAHTSTKVGVFTNTKCTCFKGVTCSCTTNPN